MKSREQAENIEYKYQFGSPITTQNRMAVIVDSFELSRNKYLIQVLYFFYLHHKGVIPEPGYLFNEFAGHDEIKLENYFSSAEIDLFWVF